MATENTPLQNKIPPAGLSFTSLANSEDTLVALTSESILPSGLILGKRYEIHELIGQGGMACVYSAKDLNLRRDIALKVLDSKHYADSGFIKRFYREARIATSLDHDNITKVFDVTELNGMHCISMELIKGKTLEKLMSEHFEKKEFFPINAACRIIIDTLKALSYAHSQGVVHRDVNPKNIMISDTKTSVDETSHAKISTDRTNDAGKVKLTDFGIARLVDSAGILQGTIITRDMEGIGSAWYMSPEQIRNSRMSGKSDVFSTGMVLYEMLTAQIPFGNVKETYFPEAMSHILNNTLIPPRKINPEIPSSLDDIIMKALDKNPTKRYDAEAFSTALKSYLSEEKIKVKGKWERRFSSRRREFIVKGGLALVGLAAAVVIPTIAIKQNHEYKQSIYYVIDKIQSPDIKNMEQLRPLLAELYPKLCERLEWIYDVELSPQLKKAKETGNNHIYLLASMNASGNEGKYGYVAGDSSVAGDTCSLTYLLFKELNKKVLSEENAKTRKMLEEKRQKVLDNFFYYSTHISFAQLLENDRLNMSDGETRVVNRFHPPAINILTELKKDFSKMFADRKRETDIIISNYAKALKIAIEKAIPNTIKNFQQFGAWKDNEITVMTCDGFRLLELNANVLNTFNEYGNSIKNVKDYLSLIISEADTKIIRLVKSSEWINIAATRDYTSLLLGIINRRNLLEDIILGADRKYMNNKEFIANVSELKKEHLIELESKAKEYDLIIQEMFNYILPKIQGLSTNQSRGPNINFDVTKFYLDKNLNSPIDIIPMVDLLEAMMIYPYQIKGIGTSKEEVSFGILKKLNSREFIAGENRLPPTIQNPLGFYRKTAINPAHQSSLGGTYICSDNIMLQLQSKLITASKPVR